VSDKFLPSDDDRASEEICPDAEQLLAILLNDFVLVGKPVEVPSI
jgi:hypothetical protein